MSLSDDLLSIESNVPAAKAPKPGEPSIEWDGETGSISTGLLEEKPKDWDSLIRAFGFDPAEVMVSGKVNTRIWDSNLGGGEVKRFHYYKADLVRRAGTAGDREDVEELKKALMRRKPIAPTKRTATATPCTRVVVVSDLQLGKEGGLDIVDRVVVSIERAILRAKAEGVERVIIINNGDTIECVVGHYPHQAFTVELDEREQKRLARRIWLRILDFAARLGIPVDVLVVPSNHGEKRQDGKPITGPTDSHDLEVMETVQDIIVSSDRHPAVRFGYPPADDPYVVTTEASGIRIAACHGHKLAGGVNQEARVHNWWKGQALGSGWGARPAGNADILITSHYHHLGMSEAYRVWFGTPALDAGSPYFTATTGCDSPSGVLSFSVGDFGSRCWADLAID